MQWLTNFLVTMTFPILLESIGLGFSYTIYAAFDLVAYTFVQLFVAETKGRTLEEISREATVTSWPLLFAHNLGRRFKPVS